MTVTVKVEVIKQLEEQIKSLQSQLELLNIQDGGLEGFERLESDVFFLEMYNA